MGGSEKPDAHTCLLAYLYSAHGGSSPDLCSLVSGPGTQKKKQKEVSKHRGASHSVPLSLPTTSYCIPCDRCACDKALAGVLGWLHTLYFVLGTSRHDIARAEPCSTLVYLSDVHAPRKPMSLVHPSNIIRCQQGSSIISTMCFSNTITWKKCGHYAIRRVFCEDAVARTPQEYCRNAFAPTFTDVDASNGVGAPLALLLALFFLYSVVDMPRSAPIATR